MNDTPNPQLGNQLLLDTLRAQRDEQANAAATARAEVLFNKSQIVTLERRVKELEAKVEELEKTAEPEEVLPAPTNSGKKANKSANASV